MPSVTRSGASALMPENAAREIIKGVANKSAAMQLFRHQKMTRAQTRIPIISSFPVATFVNGDTGLKALSMMDWTNRYLDAEELAVIVPIPEAVLEDADFDIEGEIRPQVEEALAIAIDNAVFFGVNKPASWPTAIVTAAIAAGNTVTRGTSTIDVADDINEVMKTVELDGYEVDGFWGRVDIKARLRGLRGTDKSFIYQTEGPANTGVAGAGDEKTLFGEKFIVNRAGLAGFVTGSLLTELIAGDWSQGVMGIREDLQVKRLTEASLYNPDGTLAHALAQQDMIALRFKMRVAWQVPNPINRMQATEASRYPFGVLRQPA